MRPNSSLCSLPWAFSCIITFLQFLNMIIFIFIWLWSIFWIWVTHLAHSSMFCLIMLILFLPAICSICSRYSSRIEKRQRNQRSNCQHPLNHWKSKRVPEKHILLLYWLHQSLWLCGSQRTGKLFKRWDYQITSPASWEICMQIKKQQLEPDMEQWTGSKLGKEYVKDICCHPAYLTYMQNTSYEMHGWMKHKLESRCREKYR